MGSRQRPQSAALSGSHTKAPGSAGGYLLDRKPMLGKLLARVASGIELSEHIEASGETVFRHACRLGCEGIVLKQRASPYRSGRARTWIKVKDPDSPAMTRIWER